MNLLIDLKVIFSFTIQGVKIHLEHLSCILHGIHALLFPVRLASRVWKIKALNFCYLAAEIKFVFNPTLVMNTKYIFIPFAIINMFMKLSVILLSLLFLSSEILKKERY